MARDDSPASSTAAAAARRRQCVVKWDRNLKPKLAIMRQCTSVTDRRTDGLASWHKKLKSYCKIQGVSVFVSGRGVLTLAVAAGVQQAGLVPAVQLRDVRDQFPVGLVLSLIHI